MKLQISMLCLALCSSTVFAKDVSNKSSAAEQVGYSFGYLMGRSNAESIKDLDIDAFVAGLKAASKGQASSLTDEEMTRALTQYKKQTEAKQLIELKQKADANATIGAAFLAENAKKPSIQVTKSGLQYQVIQAGKGKSPKANSTVKVHYEGRLIDGTVFDSSIARNQPAMFQVSQVIQGWTEGLQLMKEGAKYRFFIPANLGYGQIGSADVIEPNSTLIFDVELIEVLPK
ncbi:FKBP-type peptidyl-prolyl cis-trans isomerase [Acinetobacter sp. YH12128]|uniref:FKBP-type peptidyl-prolyl cis-trans isomerase n=1 Tax=Acinetobacter sp. YH12128 TaxID=2601113 RepID=UPI0015D40DFF|nr:FKBP-type peptidyl-prolyl cis-trans isomerase [Acinetobacter sp. YH12128]